jgi:hypothetical protein
MLPVTAWKSLLAVTAFLAVVSAAFLLPARHAAVPDTAFTAGQESDGTAGAQYAKPSPFTVPAPQIHRRLKAPAGSPQDVPTPAR